MSGFPEHRGRRLRRTEGLRALVRQTRLSPGRLVLPLFVLSYLHNRRRMREESRVHRDNWDKVVGFLHERVAAA